MAKEYRARIPDEDAHNWIKTLYDIGFTTEEVDKIMIHLNDTYAEQKYGTELVDDLVESMVEVLEQRKIEITSEMRLRLRELVLDKIRRDFSSF